MRRCWERQFTPMRRLRKTTHSHVKVLRKFQLQRPVRSWRVRCPSNDEVNTHCLLKGWNLMPEILPPGPLCLPESLLIFNMQLTLHTLYTVYSGILLKDLSFSTCLVPRSWICPSGWRNKNILKARNLFWNALLILFSVKNLTFISND